MKVVLFLVSVSSILVTTTTAIRCMTCENAKSNAECAKTGKVVECQENQDACQVEVRRNGRNILITKRCKQARACTNNFIQNNREAWSPVQCNMDHPHTVCRCCCYEHGCNLDTTKCPNDCGELGIPINGGRTCEFEERYTELGSKCDFTCDAGYNMVGPSSTTCVREDYTNFFTNPVPECVENACVAQTDIHNGKVTCSDGNQHGSICDFICDHGFALVGSSTTTCGTDNEWSDKRPYCVSIRCHPEAGDIDHGSVHCTNHNIVGSVCTYACDLGYLPEGETSMTCNEDDVTGAAEWSNGPPVCTPRTCSPDVDEFDHFSPECSDGNNVHSVCDLKCDDKSNMIGWPQVTCQDDGTWTPFPVCEPKTCFYQGPLENGQYECSKGEDIDSVCEFKCDDGFYLHPNTTSNTCIQKTGGEINWNVPKPCCAPGDTPPGECPRYATMDVVFSLDNRAVIGRTWGQQDAFRQQLQGKFEESPIFAKFWSVDFSTDVTTGIGTTEPPTTAVPSPHEIVEEPYYHVGISLKHIRTKVFTPEGGDRPDAPNVAVFVTNGLVPDDFEEEWIRKNAQDLRDSGVTIYGIGIGSSERLFQTLNDLTDYDPSKYYLVDNYTELLNSVDVVAPMLCPDVCAAATSVVDEVPTGAELPPFGGFLSD